MAWSAKEIRKKKYLPFPGHTDKVSAKYHSPNLPNPNVIRIEVLSPSARAQYLNSGIYAMANRFQQALKESFIDGIQPFYGFFDPEKTQGVEFAVHAKWDANSNHGFGEVAGIMKKVTGAFSKVPVVGSVGKLGTGVIQGAEVIDAVAKDMANIAGIDTNSTGACTMKDFGGSDFRFNKKVVCSWYLPEQENMARLSISRLIKLAYVRHMNMDNKDVVGALTKAASEMMAGPEWQSMTSTISQMGSEIMSAPVVDRVVGDLGHLANGLRMSAEEGNLGDLGHLANGLRMTAEETDFLPNADTTKVIVDVAKQIANGGIDAMIKLNSFFGGNLTMNPFPVRLTMGHILDIEPVVITDVQFSSSKEQFITEDGTHVPLWITATIGFDMWMIPDPKKGFIRWMGDDVFNGGSYPSSAKAGKNSGGKNSGTSGSTGGNKKKGGSKKTK